MDEKKSYETLCWVIFQSALHTTATSRRSSFCFALFFCFCLFVFFFFGGGESQNEVKSNVVHQKKSQFGNVSPKQQRLFVKMSPACRNETERWNSFFRAMMMKNCLYDAKKQRLHEPMQNLRFCNAVNWMRTSMQKGSTTPITETKPPTQLNEQLPVILTSYLYCDPFKAPK